MRFSLALAATVVAVAFPAAAQAQDDILCDGPSPAIECTTPPATHGDTSSEPATLIAPQAAEDGSAPKLSASGKRRGKRVTVTVVNTGGEARNVRACVMTTNPKGRRCASFKKIGQGQRAKKTVTAPGKTVKITVGVSFDADSK